LQFRAASRIRWPRELNDFRVFGQIPYSTEQGISDEDQGISAALTKNLETSALPRNQTSVRQASMSAKCHKRSSTKRHSITSATLLWAELLDQRPPDCLFVFDERLGLRGIVLHP
jgi:hypothetical protein